MIRKFLLAALLLLPFAAIAVADEDGPNPGGDNPGSTTITRNAYFVGRISDEDSCFDTSEFCSDYYFDLGKNEDQKGNGKHEVSASATGYALLACQAAASASSAFEFFFEGGGELSLTRHGNYGAMHHIEFGGGIAAGSMTLAAAAANSSAFAHSEAYAFADAHAWEDVCTTLSILDVEILEFCAYADAVAAGSGGAVAEAGTYASGEALAQSGTAGGLLAGMVVYGANIEEFYAVIASQVGSYSSANASAFAEAWAYAYAEAFAAAYAEACNSIEVFDDAFVEICSDSEAEAAAYASVYAAAFAQAQASALAEVQVEAYLPVHYKNENGINDTIDFGPEGAVWANAALSVNCEVPEEDDDGA